MRGDRAGDKVVSSPPPILPAQTDPTDFPLDPAPVENDTHPPLIERFVAPTTADDDGNDFELDVISTPHGNESSVDSDLVPKYLVRSLSQSAFRMLWHQHLRHLNL